PRHGARPLATSCGRLSFSKSGDTLAIFRDGKLVLVDTEHARAGAPFEPLQGFIGWRGENAVTRGAGDRITVGDRKLSELAASGGEISPDEQSVAFRLPLASPGRSSLLRDWGPAVVANLGFDGNASFFVLPLQNAHVVGWLDEEHLVVDGLTTRMHALVIVSTRTGTIVREIPASGGLGITHIEGPLDGPWLVGRSGSVVEAIAVDGTVMWQQYVATLQRDSHEVRRWAIVDGEIIGIDRAGNWWHRELPWEAAQ
ncbi:MAG TPA: hypothetical protein VG755_35550, partial [Nannocystaceae bacterium]|nr:hypothetical protein [Nannocystaceae bacterium]